MPTLFGVTGREVRIRTSTGRIFPAFRTELMIRLWSGTRFGADLPALWDTGADFVAVSEAFAVQNGIDLSEAHESLGASGIGGAPSGVLIPLAFRLVAMREVVFQVECQVLLDTDFPQPLLGNRFIRRNFNVNTVGERRTYFRLREPAPDAVSLAQLRAA